MKKSPQRTGTFFIATIIVLFLFGASMATAQSGPSFSVDWDYIPYQKFDEPPADLEGAEIKIDRADATISYPLTFAQGQTVLINQLSYQYVRANYRHWPGGKDSEPDIGAIHAAQYTLMLQQRLSMKWSIWMLVTPGMASDLQGEITKDDFNLQAAAVAIRHFSPRLSIGFGAAYSTQFGEGYPLPVLALEWNNGSDKKLSAVVPTNIEFWYLASKKIGLGLSLKVEGNEYHGDPVVYGVKNPRMKYSTLMISPTIKYYFTKSVQLNVSGGYIGLHRFEFYDGDDKRTSYDLKPGYIIRFGISYGA